MRQSRRSRSPPRRAGQRLDRVLAARIPALSRSRLKALILDGQVAIEARTIRDPATSVNSGDTVTVTLPPPEQAKPAGRGDPAHYRLRGRRADRDRQAERPGGASGRRPRQGHAGQCADRPLRRQPVRHRRRQAARHRAPARQGHHRPDGGGQDRRRPSRAQHRSSPTRPRAGSSAAISPSSGARPSRPKGTIDAPLDRTPACPRQARGARGRPRKR